MSMKILIVGGTFDNNGGRRSGMIDKFLRSLVNINGMVSYRNGGKYDDLKWTLENKVKDYDVVFWWPNVPNDLPKIRDVKEVAPHVLLVSSKRNDEGTYSFQELIGHALTQKANLTFEFKKQEDGKFHMMVFDPLGCVWYDGDDIDMVVRRTVDRLVFLMSVTRNSTTQSQTSKELVMARYFDRFKQDMEQVDKPVDIPDEEKFISIVKDCTESIQALTPSVQTTRFLGNTSMRPILPQVGRCGKGTPSFRKDGYIFVSERNVDKQFLSLENFVPTFLDCGRVYYCGDKKPSIDTPIQLRLYEKLPKINYMIHSHCYIKDAPFTSICVPCGAVEEVDIIINTLMVEHGTLGLNRYVVNLIGHGSIIMSSDLNGLSDFKYYSRPMPEKLSKFYGNPRTKDTYY